MTDQTERYDRECGCAYIHTAGPIGSVWWQVVACPAHHMNMKPLSEVPGD